MSVKEHVKMIAGVAFVLIVGIPAMLLCLAGYVAVCALYVVLPIAFVFGVLRLVGIAIGTYP